MIQSDNNYGFVRNPGPNVGKFVCYYPDADGEQSELCVLNRSKKPSEDGERNVCGTRFCRVYEFSEEAYVISKKIVEMYKSKGKTIKDGSYYHYHGMVVDGWERYSEYADDVTNP